ncbi:beta-lactamase/transpeptidase-like protein [Mycena galopus ATCC 62051]|nr:beta-lactamase/transpeptidase-like protein [Mycena galopus ATCC 62051]
MVSISQRQQDVIRGIMSRATESNTLPALFCGVTDRNGEIFMHQTGRKVLGDSSSELLDPDAIFWICSQTKLITSIAAMQQIEQGKIQLSSLIKDILPELENPVIVTARDADGKPTATVSARNSITFGQLLNHSSGITYPKTGVAYGSHPYQDSSTWLMNKIKGQPLSFEPGSDFAYGFSTDCVGFVIEKLSGKSLDNKDHIFSPLGITSPSFYLTADLEERLLPLSVRNSQNELEKWINQVEIINRDPEKTNVHFGGVGLYSSLKEYLIILRHLLQIKSGKAVNPILGATSLEALFEPTLNRTAGNTLAKMLGMPEGSAQFSTGQMITTTDSPGRRKKGTGSCGCILDSLQLWTTDDQPPGGGYASTSYFIDPESGIAAVFGTQLIPSPADYDATYEKLWSEVEQAIYAGLENVAS